MKNRIKERRLAFGMSQKDLAEEIGVSKRSISDYEAGSGLTISTAERLATTLHVNPAYLVGWSDNSGQSTPTDDQLNTVEEAADWKQSAEEKLRKLYAGGVVFHLKDGAKLYDHTDISDVEWNTDNERSLVMYGKKLHCAD